jgi:anti-sigma regulatory factor (Ser/Thr protein kinase)
MSLPEDSRSEPACPATPSGPLTLQIKVSSDPRLLAVVRSAVSELSAVSGFAEDECRCITLAVDEALSNVIRHAYKNQTDREISLTCHAQADCLEFDFSDHGDPPDLSRICGHPLDEIAVGGRGTHLIKQIMDEVCYERVSGENRLRLKKYLPGATSKAGSED